MQIQKPIAVILSVVFTLSARGDISNMNRSASEAAVKGWQGEVRIASDRVQLDGTLEIPAHAKLTCIKRLEIVPGATHLFEEPGALDIVAELAARWFIENLPAQGWHP